MRSASIVRDYGTELLRIGTMLVLGLVLTPILFRELGESGYGMWKFIQSIMFYVVVCEPALRGAMARFLAEAVGRKDISDASRVVGTSVAILVPLIALSALVAAILAPYIVNTTIKESDPLFLESVTTLRLIAMASFVSIGGAIIGAILHAMRRIDLANVLAIPLLWLKLIVFITVLFKGGGLVDLAWASLVLSLITLVISAVFLWLVLKEKAILSRAQLRPGRIPGFGRFVVFSSLAKIGDVLRIQSTLIVIASMASLEAAAIYGLVETISKLGGQALVGFADTASPRLARVASRTDEMRPMIGSLGTMLGAMSAAIAFGLLLLGVPFIRLWTNPVDEAGILEPMVQLVSITVMIGAARMVVGRSLRAQNRVGYIAGGQMVEGVCVAGLSVLLAFNIGVLGPIVARILVSGAYLLVGVPLFFRRAALVELRDYYVGCYLRPLVSAALGAIPLAIAVTYIQLDSWLALIGIGAPGVAIMAFVIYFVGIDRVKRMEIRTRASEISGR